MAEEGRKVVQILQQAKVHQPEAVRRLKCFLKIHGIFYFNKNNILFTKQLQGWT